MLTLCKTRDKPFDVLTKIRVADITSRNWASRLVNEYEVKRTKRWPIADQKLKSENYYPERQFAQTFIQFTKAYYEILKLSVVLFFILSPHSCVNVNVAISSKIGLLKKTWFLLCNKRQPNRRASSAN